MSVRRARKATLRPMVGKARATLSWDLTAAEERMLAELLLVGLHGSNPLEVAIALLRRGLLEAFRDGLLERPGRRP